MRAAAILGLDITETDLAPFSWGRTRRWWPSLPEVLIFEALGAVLH